MMHSVIIEVSVAAAVELEANKMRVFGATVCFRAHCWLTLAFPLFLSILAFFKRAVSPVVSAKTIVI